MSIIDTGLIFSTPVLMHGGLICITFCPSVRKIPASKKSSGKV